MLLAGLNLWDVPGAPVEVLLFAALAAAAIAGGIAVISAKDPFISALSLLFNFVSLGVLFLMLDSAFVAVAQILVYAGAVVVLFLFVIAYLGDRRELPSTTVTFGILRPLGLGFAALSAVGLGWIAIAADYPSPAKLVDTANGFEFGSAQAIGEAFLTKYVWVFEVTSLVLLVAATGGITLGLSGRARHDRLRKLGNTRSTDQQRKWYEQRSKAGTLVGGAHASPSGPGGEPAAVGVLTGAAPADTDNEGAGA